MKLPIVFRLAGIFGAVAALASAQPERPAPPPPAKQSSVASARPSLTFAEAQRVLASARKYEAHPDGAGKPGKATEPQVVSEVYEMDTPPPASRAETKPPAPGPELSWVEGHYMPVEKEWRWVMGAWAKPATPISVWIPGRYNDKEKKWFPGYWEPDRPPMVPENSATPAASGAAPVSAPLPARPGV